VKKEKYKQSTNRKVHAKHAKKKGHTKVILCDSLRLTLRALREKEKYKQSTNRKVHAKYVKKNVHTK